MVKSPETVDPAVIWPEFNQFIKDGFGDDKIDRLRSVLLNELSNEHIHFLKNLKLSYSIGKYLFVHAGINPEKVLKDQDSPYVREHHRPPIEILMISLL